MASRSHRLLRPAGVILALGLALAGCATEKYPQTTFAPVTEYGRISDQLFTSVFWWTMLVLLVVFSVLAYILVRYRERPDSPDPKPVYGNTVLEIAWTVIPALIIVLIAVPTIKAIFQTQRAADEGALVVQVIGHQWWWEFRYPDLGVVTASQMVVPTDRPLDIRIRSADVIHSFWFPRLGGKRDANPVRRVPAGQTPPHLNHIAMTVDSVGEFMGQCAEFCGASHAEMRMLAKAVPPEDFDAWVERMRAGAPPPDTAAVTGQAAQIAHGREVFLRSTCIACHAIAGTTAQGQVGPNLTAFGDRWSVGSGALDNTPEDLFQWIKHAPEIKAGIIMPGAETGAGGMPPTGLSDDDIRAVAAYLSSLTAGLPSSTRGGPQVTN